MDNNKTAQSALMKTLGISACCHDSAACPIRDDHLTAAGQEERWNRKKHGSCFPIKVIPSCLNEGSLTANDMDLVAFYEKPLLKFEGLPETYLPFAPLGLESFLVAVPLRIKQKLWLADVIAKELDYEGKIIFPEHHQSHLASAFFPSPFERAAFLTVDGVGEWSTTSYGIDRDSYWHLSRNEPYDPQRSEKMY